MTNFRLFQIEKCLQMKISYLMKTAEKNSKWVENTVGKEIALLFPQCFQKTFTAYM